MEKISNNSTLVSQNTHDTNECIDEIVVLTELNTDQEREIEKGIVQDYLHTYGELI